MDVRMPDGTIVSNVPDDITQSELLRRFEAYQKTQAQQTQAAQAPEDIGLLDMTGRAVMRGVKQISSTFGDVIPAMAAKAVGADEYAKQQMEEAAATQKEIEEKYAPRYRSYKDVEGIGDVLPYLLEAGAEQIPNVATVLLPGGALGAAGRGVAGRLGLEAAAARAAEKGLEGAAAEQFVSRAAAQKVGEEFGRKAGQAAGVYLGSYALNSPEVFQNVYEETGKLEPGVAMLYGSVSAALDSAFPAYVLNKLTAPVKQQVVKEVLQQSGVKPSIINSALREMGIGVVTEGLTEGAQEGISIAAEKFVKDNEEVWGSKDFQRMVDAGIAGAAGSVLFGGVAGSLHGARQKALYNEEQRRKEEETKTAGTNAYDEAAQDELDAEREAIRQEAASRTTAPVAPTPEEQVAEQVFPSAETLQAQYDQLAQERASLLNAEQTPEVQQRLQDIETQQYGLATEVDRLMGYGAPAQPGAMPQAAMGETSPQTVLQEIGRLSNEAMGGQHPSVPEIGLADGTFAGADTLNMDDQGNVVLTRVADNEEHLGKGWVNVAGRSLIDATLWHGGGRAIPTSGFANWTQSFGATRQNKVVGTFRIPANVLLQAIKDGNAILGNIGEGEIILNPNFAKQYLSEINGTPVQREQKVETKPQAAMQQGLDLGAAVPAEQRAAPPAAETVDPMEQLVTDISAAPLERFLSAVKPTSPSEQEAKIQQEAVAGKDSIVRAIRDMYEDLNVDDKELPYNTGVIKEFFNKYMKPMSPEAMSTFQNFDKLSAEEQKTFIKDYTNLPDLTTYYGVNQLKKDFNDFVSEQQLKGFGITPGTNAYAQAKKSLYKLKQKADNTPGKLDRAERAAHDYFRRFDFDTAMRAAAFDMAYGTPRNELFSGQGAETAPFFQEWMLLNASPAVNRKFDNYLRAYEKRAARDLAQDKVREEATLTEEAQAEQVEDYEAAQREDLLGPFATSETVTGSMRNMLHPAVERAIKNNDLNGALRNMLAVSQLTPYQKQLVTKLLSLKLNTSVDIGPEALRQNVATYLRPGSEITRDYFYVARQLGALKFTDLANAMMNVDKTTLADEKLVNMYLTVGRIYEDNKNNPQLSENLKTEISKLLDNLRNLYLVIEKSGGSYFPITDSISLNPQNNDAALTNYVFLHEVMHAATTRIINNPEAYGPKQEKAVKELEALYEHAKLVSGVKKYGFTDLNEFVAEAFTNHDFQKVLQGIKYKNTTKSLWDKFIDFCLRMFGYDNVLGQTMLNVGKLLEAPRSKGDALLFGNPVSAANRGFFENNSGERVGAVEYVGDLIRNSEKFDDIKFALSELWSTMKDQTRKYWLGAFTLRQLEEMIGVEYGKSGFEPKVNHVSQLIRTIEDMVDSRNKTIQRGKPILDKLMKFYTSNQAVSERLTRLIQTATANQVDPSDANPPTEKRKQKLYDELRKEWDEIGQSKDGAVAQELYHEMRDFFKSTLNNYKKIAIEREFRRILGSVTAGERAQEEYTNRTVLKYKAAYKDLSLEEIQQMVADELEQDVLALVSQKGFSAEEALARVLASKKIEDQFKDMIDPYFPLKRFGRFWFKTGTGKDMKFYMFETAAARNKALNQAKAGNPNEAFSVGNDVGGLKNEVLRAARLFEDLRDIIGSAEATDSEQMKKNLMDELGELFITTMPTQSIRNMFLHRKNVPGASADMVRSFAHAMFHIAYQQSRFEFSPRMFDNLSAAKSYISTLSGETVSPDQARQLAVLKEYLDEIGNRVETTLNPPEQNWATTLLSNLSFLNYLTAPASAIVNMLAVPTIGYPVLAGPFGWGPSRQAYSKYMAMLSGSGWKDELGNFDAPSIGRNPKLTATEKKAYQAFVDAGLIDVSMTHDIAGLAEQPSNEYTGRWHKIMTLASFPFHKAERFNREVTAMAAFDLAYKKNGGNFEDAVQQAKNLTYKSMFDYSTANKPRYFQGNLPKVLLQFKQYAQHMTYLLFRTAYESTKMPTQEEYDEIKARFGQDEADRMMASAKELQKEARRTFTGMMGMSFLFAGTMGMPVWFIFSGIANAFAAVFGDDEEQYDVENWYKNWLNSVFGGFVGDSIARGVVPQVTNVSLSDRMSTNLGDMWFRDVKKNQDEVSYVQNLMINLLGPVAGMAVNSAEAVKRFNDGHTERAFETIAPALIKNIMAGSRLASEGALTMKGDTLLEDISAKEAFTQMLGFTPERLAQRQVANIEAKGVEEAVKSRRQDLLNFLAMAYDAEDDAAVDAVLEKIDAFNEANPENAIKGSTIRASLKKRAKERAMASERGGLRINKAFADRAEEMTRYAEDEEE